MSSTRFNDDASAALVDIVDMKWLLAGEGVRVNVERLQADPAYARACLDRASASRNEAVRGAAHRLRTRLCLG